MKKTEIVITTTIKTKKNLSNSKKNWHEAKQICKK